MNLYKLLKLASGKLPGGVKIIGLAAMHACGRRVAGVFVDPVMSCNLRCKMCYFSDPERRRELHGVMTPQEIDTMTRALLPRAVKLQIGCGAEPTLWGNERLCGLVSSGRQAGVPYISLTTNGQLIASGSVSLAALAAAGLDELTLSMHGTSAEVYEDLMPGARYDNLLRLTRLIAEVKRTYPRFRLRVNFTVNSRNIHDLKDGRFWQFWDSAGVTPDVIQLRPVQKIGESEWDDFDLTPLRSLYDRTFAPIIAEAARRGVTCIAPSPQALDEVATDQDGASTVIEDFTYCYVAPGFLYKADFNAEADTFGSYHRRHHTLRHLLLAAVNPRAAARSRNSTKKLNYEVKS